MEALKAELAAVSAENVRQSALVEEYTAKIGEHWKLQGKQEEEIEALRATVEKLETTLATEPAQLREQGELDALAAELTLREAKLKEAAQLMKEVILSALELQQDAETLRQSLARQKTSH